MSPAMDTLRTVLPVLLMLFLGAFCRRKAIISREGIQALKTVAVQIALPAVLLHTFAVTQYTFRDVMIPLIMFAVCVAAWLLGKALGPRLGMKSPFVPYLTTGFEAGMLGYALFTLLYGSERIPSFARIDLGQVLFVFTLYKILLSRSEGKQTAAKTLVREMVSSPIILAIAAGVLLGATGLYQALIPSGLSALMDACTDFVSAPVAALILLAIGYDLVFDNIPWKDALSVTCTGCSCIRSCPPFITISAQCFTISSWPSSSCRGAYCSYILSRSRFSCACSFCQLCMMVLSFICPWGSCGITVDAMASGWHHFRRGMWHHR